MECFGTTDFDNNSRLITLSAIIISGLHCIIILNKFYFWYIFILFLYSKIFSLLYKGWSRDSSVGIATRYGLECPGIESRWGEIFRTYPDRLRGPPNLLYNGYRVFPGGKGGRGVMLTTHRLLVPRLRKSWAIPPLTLWVLLGLLRGSLYHIRGFCQYPEIVTTIPQIQTFWSRCSVDSCTQSCSKAELMNLNRSL
jgi:hypothetical protein